MSSDPMGSFMEKFDRDLEIPDLWRSRFGCARLLTA
jgi:hypothetical protein